MDDDQRALLLQKLRESMGGTPTPAPTQTPAPEPVPTNQFEDQQRLIKLQALQQMAKQPHPNQEFLDSFKRSLAGQ